MRLKDLPRENAQHSPKMTQPSHACSVSVAAAIRLRKFLRTYNRSLQMLDWRAKEKKKKPRVGRAHSASLYWLGNDGRDLGWVWGGSQGAIYYSKRQQPLQDTLQHRHSAIIVRAFLSHDWQLSNFLWTVSPCLHGTCDVCVNVLWW